MNKSELRTHFRTLRCALSAQQQRKAAQYLWKNICSLPEFCLANNIALYFANDGEISPHVIAHFAHEKRINTFFPVLTRAHMIFRRHQRRNRLQRNRYNIREPLPRCSALSATQLDVVLLPLVSFDERGNRLGMGGGFYDRTFAFKRRWPGRPPVLIGVAHEIQKYTQLTCDNWDIPLDMIVTEKNVYRIVKNRWQQHTTQ